MKYFLHDTSAFDDEKVSELFLKFGYEGLGLFYTTLEKFGKQEKPIKTDVLKAQLRVGKRLEKCWSFMEEIGLISSSNGESFNKQLLNFSENFKIKKEKNKERILQWRNRQEDTKNVTRSEFVRNASKVKESKVNKSNYIGEDDFIAKIITAFQSSYFEVFGSEYLIISKGKERSAASKIAAAYKKKNPDATTEKTLSALKDYFTSCCQINDEWMRKNMSLSVIVSKFNEINNTLKNGKNKSVAARSGQVDAIVEAVFSNQ